MRKLRVAVAVLIGFGMGALVPDRAAWSAGSLLLNHLADRTATIPEPPPGKVALRLSLAYTPEPLPGGALEFYEPSSDADSLWAMESLPKGEALHDVVFLAPGEERMVTVAFRNPTAAEIGFMVMPHRESPVGLAPETWLTCFCMAHVYRAPAEGAWYRVLRIKVSPDMPPGSKVDALWTILTDPADFPMTDY
jgi:hypothetical protein